MADDRDRCADGDRRCRCRARSGRAPRIAGGLLVVSGSYAVSFGRHELRVYDGDLQQDRFVELGTNLQIRFVVVAQSIGSLRIGLAIVTATLLTYTVLRLRMRPMTVTTPAESDRKETSIRNEHEEQA